jgi:hypothetical protein
MRLVRRVKRTLRKAASRPRGPVWEAEMGIVRADLRTCMADIQDLRRVITSLRAELDHLREKIRG